MSRILLTSLIALFIITTPSISMAQLNGTLGQLDCDTSPIFGRKSPVKINGSKRKKISRKAALKFIRRIVRPTQRSVIKDVRRMRTILQNASPNFMFPNVVSQHLPSGLNQRFDRIFERAKKTEHLQGSPPDQEGTIEDALVVLEGIFSRITLVASRTNQAAITMKRCSGCQTDLNTLGALRKSKKGKKKKCDCYKKTVSATMEFYEGNEPGAPRNCRAFGLAKWSAEETENATGVEVFYTWTGSGDSLRSKVGIDPYDDTYPFYDQEILAGEGNHQLELTKGSKSHGNPDKTVDCSEMSALQQQLVINPYVEAEICPLK